MKIYTGTSGYGYKEWKGGFYPEKLAASKMLSYYSARLETVEINNTYYRMPTLPVVKAWALQVPGGFVFAIKAPQIITHIKRLENVAGETRFFLSSVSALNNKLGCVLFQFPASFRDDQRKLKDFLRLIPAKIPCAFDFRSATWMNSGTFTMLKKRNFCICMEDTEEKPIKKITSTADWGYFRLRREDYTKAAVKLWAKKIRAQKWRKAFVFFKHEEEDASKASKAPELALLFMGLVP